MTGVLSKYLVLPRRLVCRMFRITPCMQTQDPFQQYGQRRRQWRRSGYLAACIPEHMMQPNKEFMKYCNVSLIQVPNGPYLV